MALLSPKMASHFPKYSWKLMKTSEHHHIETLYILFNGDEWVYVFGSSHLEIQLLVNPWCYHLLSYGNNGWVRLTLCYFVSGKVLTLFWDECQSITSRKTTWWVILDIFSSQYYKTWKCHIFRLNFVPYEFCLLFGKEMTSEFMIIQDKDLIEKFMSYGKVLTYH
jgi:hypothetical protein